MQSSKLKTQKYNLKLKSFYFCLRRFAKASPLWMLLPFTFSLLSSQVHAQGLDLSVAPAIFQIELTPPADVAVSQNLTLQNNSDDPVSLAVQLKPFVPDESDDGKLRYLNDGETMKGADPHILDDVALMDNGQQVKRVELGPKEKRQFDLSVAIPKDEPPSDYYFSIVFLNTPEPAEGPSQSSSTLTAGGVAVNVLLSIGPQTQTTGSIEEFSTPFFVQSGPVPFTVKINNTSSHFVYPKAQIIIKNMFGQAVGKVDLLPVNILSNSVRAMPSKEDYVFTAQAQNATSEEQRTQNKELNLSHPVGIWPETFLLGPYTATLTVAMSDNGPLLTQTTHFVGVPLTIIGSFVVAVLLILLIRSRLQRHAN